MRLWQELSLPDDATNYPWSVENVTKSPGWQRATPLERSSILRCAEAWLINERLAQEDIFLPDNSTGYKHIATYLALRLLIDEKPESLVSLPPPETWSQLAVALIGLPI